MFLTEAQQAAIHNHEDNLIVVAGAGSGKTFVLVERYLALLDRHPEWPLNALVAITFTQKAAQEMRDRVRQHLQRRADERDGEAAAQWAGRLAAMDSARIDTIHGLCAVILRGNAAEAGVDPGFEVLDEIEAGVLLEDAIDDVLRSLAADDPVLELFAEYGERGVRGLLNQTSKLQILSEFNPKTDDLFTDWLAQWVADSHKAIERFVTTLSRADFYAPIGVDSLSQRWQDVGEVAEWFAASPQQTERALLYVYVDQVKRIADLRIPGARHKDWGDDWDDSKAAFTVIRDAAKDTLSIIEDAPGALDLRAARLLPLWGAIAAKVRAAYRLAKDERGALDFDDLETKTCELLQDDDVRARYLNAAFRHVLVDEFQDTNAAQWTIIRRLADPDQPGCLFVVGDPKQSIYGFRGADVSVFEQVKGVITARGAAVNLNRSFRTHQRLVDCLNDLFDRILTQDETSPVKDYEVAFGGGMAAERTDAPSDAPVLELLLLDKAKLKAGERADSRLPRQDADWGEEEGVGRRWEARALARRIKQMVEAGRLIFDKGKQIVRPMGYGDVALLFQAMTHVTLYESALKAEGIPYLTIAGKGYYDRQEVWDLLNLLRALYNPLDNLSLATALRSPLFSLSDDALLALRLITDDDDQPIPLWAALDQPEVVPADEREVVDFARVTLRDLRRKAGRVTIAELLRLALEATGYLAVLTGLPDGKRRRGNVEKLLEKAETSGRITLGAFTEYLKDMSENEVREGEAALESDDAVQLMTVHKSKGLEFPLVVLVDASYRGGSRASDPVNGLACKVYDAESNGLVETYAYRRAKTLDQLRETAERRRLFYVAATRAQDTLLVSGHVSYKEGKGLKATGWLGWVIDALELKDIEPKDSQLFDDGMVRVDFPEPLALSDEGDEIAGDWDAPFVGDAAINDAARLLQPLPKATEALTRSLTATQMADLGGAWYAESGEQRALFAERWRRSVLHDAPERIEALSQEPTLRVSEIVRRALRLTLPENDRDLREILRRYAWEEGIVEEGQNRRMVQDAYDLLKRVQRSEVFGWMEGARAVYRELPFVYQTERRTIHGIIDLLIQDQAGRWRLIDTKTAVVAHNPSQAMLENHARRYSLQAGVYAAAVRELVGIAPMPYIYYIRYAKTVMIPENAWESALIQLEDTIRDVINHGSV